jgi:hypothetical protein
MSSAFRKKKYGKVRPVPKPKEKGPSKPAVNQLKSIFTAIKRSPDHQLNDLFSEALIWWRNAIAFIQWHYNKKQMPLEAAKAFDLAIDHQEEGRDSLNNEVKKTKFIHALGYYRRYAAAIIKTPDLAPYLKKSKEVTKKVKDRNKKLTTKFDSIISLLEKCFDEPSLTLAVCDTIQDKGTGKYLDYKWDHELSTLYYSRDKAVRMKKTLFHQGLLQVVLEEAYEVARGLSFTEKIGAGSFIVDPVLHLKNFDSLLDHFERFSHHPDCPKQLSKREKPKNKKEKL